MNDHLVLRNELGNIQPIESHIGYIPNQGARSSVFDNLLLVGDSAGQSNPLVLEGIRHAIEFGRLAGLIGSEAVRFFSNLGMDVIGIDNDMRKFFFGEEASTKWNRQRCCGNQ